MFCIILCSYVEECFQTAHIVEMSVMFLEIFCFERETNLIYKFSIFFLNRHETNVKYLKVRSRKLNVFLTVQEFVTDIFFFVLILGEISGFNMKINYSQIFLICCHFV